MSEATDTAAAQRNWWESPFERRSVQLKMGVWAEDGTRLGYVSAMSRAGLSVRPHKRARSAFHIPLEAIVGLTADGVRVRGAAGGYALGPETGDPAAVSAHTLPLADTLLAH
ncbi:hypothetical protein FGE12_04260 [Aggregicoccus sp. 17bor-14]|uniref:hypothetical protein n=1 Tax=Myxococcaceae TaxID=31 RepID=UPI00129C2391|nr:MULTISPECIES: hypothetical protein [Myxococcaceae]MBF5041589.1 hypothetical protein [Simulacricoccus sp. 17bor-14]MRI87374.1 hypothetical protein [Aggregicoccus sp. 17bor-14]